LQWQTGFRIFEEKSLPPWEAPKEDTDAQR
jgi:hypothetical protein